MKFHIFETVAFNLIIVTVKIEKKIATFLFFLNGVEKLSYINYSCVIISVLWKIILTNILIITFAKRNRLQKSGNNLGNAISMMAEYHGFIKFVVDP